MKNLKKVLALVLVVATLMGFATVAGAKFSDDSSVTYKEAVDVMAGIGVINGYTDGTFRPTANVTRAQMAKMVAYILASGDDVGDLYAGANTFSDCTTHWARGYIAYASKTGFVAGVGNGRFNPEGSVTGTQAAKMLLCALGYDATIEQYVGANWAVNTLADAKTAGLLKNLNKIDMSAALTREAAAQMMFNALNAKTVKYSNKGSNIVINGIEISQGASDPEFINISDNDNKVVYETLRAKYFEDLDKKEGQSDDFGRPGNKWTYKKDDIGTYGSAADDVFVLEDDYSATKGGLIAALQDEDLLDNSDAKLADDVKIAVNGDKTAEATEALAAMKRGSVVEVFLNEDDSDEITAVVVYYYSVSKIDEVDDDIKASDEKDGVSYYVSLEDFDTVNDIDLPGFDAKTYVEGAYVAYIDNGTDVIASNIADTVTGSVTTRNTKDGYLTVDGTKYYAVGALDLDLTKVSTGSDYDYTLYLDVNDNLIGFEENEGQATIDDVYYVVANWTGSDNYNKPAYFAQLVALTDGSVSEIELEQDMSKYSVSNGDLVTISDKKNGDFKANNDKYDLTEWADADYDTDATVVNGAKFTKSGNKVDQTGDLIRLNSSTQYIMVEGSEADLSASLKTGGISYTVKAADDVTVITEDGKNIALYVIIAGADTSESVDFNSDDILYVDAVSDEKGDGFYTQEVYLADGTKDSLNIADDEYPSFIKAGQFFSYAENEDGYYELDTPADFDITKSYTWDDESGVVTGASYVDLYEGLLSIKKGEFTVADIETDGAAFVDLHDQDASGQYDRGIASLSRLASLIEDGKVADATLALNISSDGAVTIILTSATSK